MIPMVTRLHNHDGALQWILLKSFPNPPCLRRARVQRVKSWEQGCDCMHMCACFCNSWHGVFPHWRMVSVPLGMYSIIFCLYNMCVFLMKECPFAFALYLGAGRPCVSQAGAYANLMYCKDPWRSSQKIWTCESHPSHVFSVMRLGTASMCWMAL